VFAAISSSISMIEPAISWLEQNWHYSRRKSAWILGSITWVIGLGSVLSFNLWQDKTFFADKTFFDTMDFLTSNMMLPLGGLFTAIFVGWVWSQQQRNEETGMPAKWSPVYQVIIKWVAPILVFIVFVNSVF